MPVKHNRKKRIIKCLIICCILIIVGVWIFISQYQLSVQNYQVQSDKVSHPFTIIQLSDLHNRSFGKNNKNLIKRIEKINPDIICMTGDMLKKNVKDVDVMISLIQELSQRTPVFFSYGNHEKDYENNFQISLRSKIEKAGATVLDNQSTDIEINGNLVTVGGVSEYALIEPSGDGKEYQFLKSFEGKSNFQILLSHMPAGMLLWKGLETWKIDLVLSGHEHGGEVILPGIGGLYSQDEGFFPKYTAGMFVKNHHVLILSKGLGSSEWIPRINNSPEIVKIRVCP